MSAASVWTPVFSATAALIGGGFGAMLQGRYGVSGWRRQTRLEAYARFVNDLHDYNECLRKALDAFGQPDFNDRWSEVREAQTQLGKSGSLISIAGPLSVVHALNEVGNLSISITVNGINSGLVSEMALAQKNGQIHEELRKWRKSANNFQRVCRGVLKTQGKIAPIRGNAFRRLRG